MRVFNGSERVDEASRGGVLTIGNFDGLHLGHQALIRAVVERGRALGAPAGLYTFDPHPRSVLYPDEPLPRLMSWDQLELGVRALHVGFLVREPFTSHFAGLSPEAFLTQVIAQCIAPREIFVGRDFHFGRGGSGSGENLGRIGPTLGIRVTIIPQVLAGGKDVSSTRVRSLLAAGQVEDAALCLGRPYAVWGRVVEGDRRGRTLGFPTANLELENDLVPANGVYATSVRLFEGERLEARPRPSVTNVGTRPTFEPGRVLAEAHLLDFEGDLYGRRLALEFHARIRDERRFSGPDELRAQISRDADRARRFLRQAVP